MTHDPRRFDNAVLSERDLIMTSNEHSEPQLPQQRPLREKEDITVHDKEGFLCRIILDVDFKLTPEELMRIFTNPDNTGVFRDIYAVPHREVVEDDGEGRQKVVVEQVSGFRFLVVPITFSTHLNVEKNLKKGIFRPAFKNWDFLICIDL